MLAIACLLLPIVAALFTLLGIARTRSLMSRLIPGRNPTHEITEQDLAYANRVAWLVTVAANHGAYRANCLKQALVTQLLLARKGLATDLKVGIKSSGDPFHAHSWVELLGEPLANKSTTVPFNPVCTFRLEH